MGAGDRASARERAARVEADPRVVRAREAYERAARGVRFDVEPALHAPDRGARERAWWGRAREAVVLAAPLVELARARNAAAGGSAYELQLEAIGLDAARVGRTLDRIVDATEWDALAERRAELGVDRLGPWDLHAAPGAARPLRPWLAEAAARLGFDLDATGIAVEQAAAGEGAATIVEPARVRLRARGDRPREALHELGHALRLACARGAERDAEGPLDEGIAELVAGLQPRAAWDDWVELRHAVLRAAFERELYAGGADPGEAWLRLARELVGVDPGEATPVWGRLRHLARHPGRLACYPLGAAIAARLRQATAGLDGARLAAWLVALFVDASARAWDHAFARAVSGGGGLVGDDAIAAGTLCGQESAVGRVEQALLSVGILE